MKKTNHLIKTDIIHMFSSRSWAHPLKSDRNYLAWEGCQIHLFHDERQHLFLVVSEKSNPDLNMQIQ